jgi:hypothetical protein
MAVAKTGRSVKLAAPWHFRRSGLTQQQPHEATPRQGVTVASDEPHGATTPDPI